MFLFIWTSSKVQSCVETLNENPSEIINKSSFNERHWRFQSFQLKIPGCNTTVYLPSHLKHRSWAVQMSRHDLLSNVDIEAIRRQHSSSVSSVPPSKCWHHGCGDRTLQFVTQVQRRVGEWRLASQQCLPCQTVLSASRGSVRWFFFAF